MIYCIFICTYKKVFKNNATACRYDNATPPEVFSFPQPELLDTRISWRCLMTADLQHSHARFSEETLRAITDKGAELSTSEFVRTTTLMICKLLISVNLWSLAVFHFRHILNYPTIQKLHIRRFQPRLRCDGSVRHHPRTCCWFAAHARRPGSQHRENLTTDLPQKCIALQ